MRESRVFDCTAKHEVPFLLLSVLTWICLMAGCVFEIRVPSVTLIHATRHIYTYARARGGRGTIHPLRLNMDASFVIRPRSCV
jgi:hypothetical protein